MTIARAPLSKLLRFAPILLIVIAPAVFIVSQIPAHYTPIPFQDEWSLGLRLAIDSLSIGDFFGQHNEHRHLIPMFILTMIARVTKWSQTFEPLLNILFVLISLGAIVVLARPREGDSISGVLVAGVPASIFLFSPAQFDVWLWPWMIVSTMTVALLCCGALALSAGTTGRFWLGVACCFAAALSSAQGLFTWIALAPVAIRDSDRNRFDRRRLTLWAGAALVSWVVYFRGMTDGSASRSLSKVFGHPLQFAEFVFAAAGAPWTRIEALAVVAGILQIASLGWLGALALRRGAEVSRALACLGIGAWTLLFAAASAAGRLEYGIGTALTSRYLASTAVLPAAFFALVAIELRHRPILRTRVLVATIVLAALVWTSNYSSSTKAWKDIALERKRGAICLGMSSETGTSDNPCIEILFPHLPTLLDIAGRVERAGVRSFTREVRVPRVKTERAGRFSAHVLSDAGRTRISGLVMAPDTKPNPGLIFLDMGDEKLWCCGFSSDLTIMTSGSKGAAREWIASVPDELLRGKTEIFGWAFMEDPDRLAPLDGSLTISNGN